MPIHCIGIQAYFREDTVSLELMANRLDKLASLGLDLYITEFSFVSDWSSNINYMDEVRPPPSP